MNSVRCILILLLIGSFSFFAQASDAKLSIDLKQIRALALEATNASNLKVGDELGIWFQDGVGATDAPTIYDFSHFVVLFEPAKPIAGGFKIAFRLGLQGENSSMLAQLDKGPDSSIKQILYSFPDSGVILLQPNTTPSEVEALAAGIRQNVPNLIKLAAHTVVPIITFEAKSFQDTLSVFETISSSPLVKMARLSKEAYRTPFVFDQPKYLGTGLDSKIVIPDDLRTISMEYKKKGKVWVHGETKLHCERLLSGQ